MPLSLPLLLTLFISITLTFLFNTMLFLQVELLHGPDAVITRWQQLSYPHITLTVGEGCRAVDSNELPRRVADESDVAYRVELNEPLVVSGQVLPYQ